MDLRSEGGTDPLGVIPSPEPPESQVAKRFGPEVRAAGPGVCRNRLMDLRSGRRMPKQSMIGPEARAAGPGECRNTE